MVLFDGVGLLLFRDDVRYRQHVAELFAIDDHRVHLVDHFSLVVDWGSREGSD